MQLDLSHHAMMHRSVELCLLVFFFVTDIPPVICPPPDAPRIIFQDMYDLLSAYITAGYCYQTILAFLKVYHDFHWSIATLKRKLKAYGLGHRINRNTDAEVDSAILHELLGPRSRIGYRSMWRVLRHFHALSVSREQVMERLRVLDPEGTRQRRVGKLQRRAYFCPGPNHNWHCDGYDKLKVI